MNRAVGFIAAALLGGSGCGDNQGPPPLTPDQLLERLRSLPGVTASQSGTVPGADDANFTYYTLQFTQPMDHEDASKGFFRQKVSLLHRNESAATPMIVQTSGYADDWGKTPTELTTLLASNQVSIEHRYYGDSRPEPADWSYLTIKQMADDEHDILEALKRIYHGAFVSTGASKGGMTAVFHRSFYPDDVAGTVAYVAPISFNAPDVRYANQFDKIGTPECRAAVRALAAQLLSRAEEMEALAGEQARQEGYVYNRVALGPAVEAAIAGLEWSYWQSYGDKSCLTLPAVTASDEDLFKFLATISPVKEFDDERIAKYEAYCYQMHSQLGFPQTTGSYLLSELTYAPEDYTGELPTTLPEYSMQWMKDIGNNVAENIAQLVFIYGTWDPWYGGAFPTGRYADKYVVDNGNHRVRIIDLAQERRDAALASVAEWTGVTPVVSRLRRMPTAGLTDVERSDDDTEPSPPPLLRIAPR